MNVLLFRRHDVCNSNFLFYILTLASVLYLPESIFNTKSLFTQYCHCLGSFLRVQKAMHGNATQAKAEKT